MYYTKFTPVKHWCPKEILFSGNTQNFAKHVLHQFDVSLKLVYTQPLFRDCH